MYKPRVIFVVLISAIFLLKCDIGESNPVANNENSRNKISGITGTVQDNQGTAIAEVNVTAYPGESTAKTTGKGEFVLENLYSGIGYRLYFSKDGYRDTSIEVINLGFNSIDTLPFEIKMSPRSSSGDLPVTDTVPDTPKTVLPSAFELIDDFEDGDSISKLNTKWYTAKDFSYLQVYEENYGNTVWKPCNESTEITANLAFKGGANSSGQCASVTYTIGDDYQYEKVIEQGAGLGVDMYADFSDSKCKGISFYHKGDSMRVKIGYPLGEAFKARDFLVEKSDNWKLVTLSWGDINMQSSLQYMPVDYLKVVSRIIFGVNGSEGEKGTFYIDNLKLINEPIKPSIVKQPYLDGNYLSIDVLGKPVVCQWQKDGVNIAAEAPSPLLCAYYGAGTYRCIVTNSAGSVVSEPVVITEDQLL